MAAVQSGPWGIGTAVCLGVVFYFKIRIRPILLPVWLFIVLRVIAHFYFR
jgi:hypothetical protein